jgi:hairy-and-enhancer-of-split protein
MMRVFSQEGFSHCASEACSFLLSLPGLDSVVGRRLVEYLAKSVSRALESQVTATNKPPAAAAQMAAVSPAAVAAASINACSNGSGDDSNGGEAAARGHTPPSNNPPPTPPEAAAALSCPTTVVNATLPPQKPVALTSSNRSPHTVVRPKPTRPAFGPSSSSPHSHDVAAAAVAAAQRDPMWRPW